MRLSPTKGNIAVTPAPHNPAPQAPPFPVSSVDSITCASVRLGFLLGDVNGDRTASPVGILFLVDLLDGVGPVLPIWATDIDRSGLAAPADILALIDLLNGASGFGVWNGASLP